VHGVLRGLSGETIDDPVVAWLSEGRADLNLHGSPWIIHRVLDMARQAGFHVDESLCVPLDPSAVDRWPMSTGSDTIPSAANGQPSVIERDVLTHIPLARTELAVRALLAQPQAWKVWEALEPPERRRQAAAMVADRALWWLLHPPRVAIVGPPNAGKSTLANQLFAQERSIVADQPGTTRDWVGELANINDLAVMLVDTPGQRSTDDPIEREAISQSGEVIQSADLIVLVFDASMNQAADPEMATDVPILRVANKQDRRTWEAADRGALPLTATTGQGIDALRQEISRHFGCEQLDLSRPRWWTESQRILLEKAL
jgi:small GTP-binding protein